MTSRSRRHVTAIRPASTATTNHQLTIWNNRQSLGLSPVFRTRPTQEEFELRIYGRNSNLQASLIIGGAWMRSGSSSPPWQWGVAIFFALCLSIYLWTLQ